MSTKAAVKTVWVLILAAFLIGLGLAGIGVALGGNVISSTIPLRFVDVRTGTFYDRGMTPLNAPGVTDSKSDVVREDIHTISVTGVNARILLIPASEGSSDANYVSYSIDAQNVDDYDVSVRNGRLSIEYRIRGRVHFFPDFGWMQASSTDDIVVRVPEGVELRDVNLQVVSGEVDVQTKQSVQIDNLVIDAVSASIDVEHLGVLTPSSLRVNSVSGNTTVRDSRLSDFRVTQISGSTTAEIANLDDFRIEVNTVSGHISKDGETLFRGIGDHIISGPGGFINIDTVSGSVDLWNLAQDQFESEDDSIQYNEDNDLEPDMDYYEDNNVGEGEEG
ncbi:MAG: DUF4097 domain-containing protein [Coriobacteriia bacterium]|nr:DUF4097 domain-containing protein [Coriobacteriia bacterium]MCL2870543.1 DUF4097 domain-containing protein [Coriobacteriia bacterium]